MFHLEDPLLISRFYAVVTEPDQQAATSTPIFINCFNRLTQLRSLVDWLLQAGQRRIVLLDNMSTYPPLLQYYQELDSELRVTVVKLPLNYGHMALWESGILDRLGWAQQYVYTDPDVLPVGDCPHDFVSYFSNILNQYPAIIKAGFGLIIDDIPDCYRFKNEVLTWEKQFYDFPIAPNLYFAPVDTTFALYRGCYHISDRQMFETAKRNAIRTGAPYLARHLDWYMDSDHPSEEQMYYRTHALPGVTSWNLETIPVNVAHDVELARRGVRMIQDPDMPIAAPAICPPSINQVLQQAISNHQEGNLHEAERLYRTVLTVEPQHPDANHNLGVLAVQNNQPDSGLPFFKVSLDANPGIVQYWQSYIDTLIHVGQFALARQVLADGRQQGLTGEAVDAFEARLAGPSHDESNELVARFCEGRYSEAELFARRLTEQYSEHGLGWKVLGATLMSQGRKSESLEPTKKAAELLPMDAEAHNNLSNTLRIMGRFIEAEASCHRALEINPDYAEAHFNLGNVLNAMHRFLEAAASYTKALEIKPDFSGAENNLSIVRMELVRAAEAKANLRSIRESRLMHSGQDGKGMSRFNLLDLYRKNEFIGKLIGLFGGAMFFLGMFLTWDSINIGGAKRHSYAAKVNGVEISLEAFNNSYARNRELNKTSLGDAFTPALEAKLAIRKTTLDALVNNELLYCEAVRLGLTASDDEVKHSIATMPIFSKNGEFDLDKYKQILASNNQLPQLFEKMQRRNLLANKARMAVVNSVKVTDHELKELYHKERDRIVLSYVIVTPKDVWNDIKVTPVEIKEYFDENKALFMSQEMVAISYIRLALTKNQDSESVSPSEIENYYARNLLRYRVAGGVAPPLQQIKERVSKDLKREINIKALLEKAADARFKNSKHAGLEPVSDTLGVPLNNFRPFTATAPPPALVGAQDVIKKIFALKDGEIGGPYETDDAVYLVRVSGRQLPVPVELSSVRKLIENRILTKKAETVSKNKAEEMLSQLADNKLSKLVRVTETFGYNAAGSIAGLGTSQELMEEVLLLTPSNPVAKRVFRTTVGWCAVRFKQRISASESDFELAKEELAKRILPVRQQKTLVKWFADRRAVAKVEINKQLATEIAKDLKAEALD